MRLLTALGCGGLLALGFPTRTPGPLPALPAAVPTLAGAPEPAVPADRVAPPASRVRPLAGPAHADTAFHWPAGSRVHTWNGGDASVTGVFVRADSTAVGAVLATVALGIKGTLRSGPFLASDGGQRWKVAWDGSVTGWSRQIYLALEPVAPPVSVATTVTINQSVVELVGQRTPIVAMVRDQAGAVMAVPVTWASRNPTIAIVDTAGVVLGVAPGIDTVTATSGAAQGQTLVMIQALPVPPPSTTVLPRVTALTNLAQSVSIPMGSYFMATAQPADSAGDVLGNIVTWTIADSSIVKVILPWGSVSQAAEVVALAPGTTTVTASVGTVRALLAVTVTHADTVPLVTFPVAGVQVPSLPALRHFTLPITMTLYSRPCYMVNFTAPGTDSVVATTTACIHKP